MNTLGRWITNNTKSPFYARREITIDKVVKKATAKVCGLGQFNFYINGKKVEDHVLDPGWTNYNKVIQYVEFDVTKYLGLGENVLGAEVGNGWFIKNDEYYTFELPKFMPPNPNPYKVFCKSLVFAINLEITYEDDSIEIINADNNFKVAKHAITQSNVYGSETIDGRLVQEGWNNCGFDDSTWDEATIVEKEDEPKGELIEQFQPAIKIIKTYEGKFVHKFNNREIYDFSQNMSGILELEVKGKVGDVIKIYPAEKLSPEGDVDQMAKDWVMVDNCITYVIGKDDIWETCKQEFTYFAGRFIAVEYIVKDSNVNEMDVRNIKGHAISSAHKDDGYFKCDDERFNQIYDMILKAVEANMVSVHTDCPTIERFAWQEPNHLMAPSIMYMKDGRKLWEKFLMDMRVDQHSEKDYFFDFEGNKFYPGAGLMPSQCPCYIPNVLPVPGMGSFYDIIPWGSTCILGTYHHYMFYGDKQVIEDNYDAGMKYLSYLKTKVNEDGFINHGLGDWGNPKENSLARENIETAFLYADTITLAKFAEILGKIEDKKELDLYAEKIKENYNKKLLTKHPNGFYCYKTWDHKENLYLTQAGQAIPLYWGLVPQDKEDDIVKALKYTLEEEGSFIAGEIGLPYIIQSARKYNMNDLICKFILKKEHPSYYAFVLDGETTLGEYWEENPRSHCHDMMGHIIEWYYNGMAGIIPKKPGFSEVLIKPYLPESINEFECSYNSVNGEIKVKVKRCNNEIEVNVEVAENIEYMIDRSNLNL